MSSRWHAEQIAKAERVPVWIAAPRPRFTGTGPGFAAWSTTEETATIEEPAEPPADAFAQGFAHGFAAGEGALHDERAALQDERTALHALAAGLESLRPEPPADLARLLAETVSRLVTQIVGEVALDEALIARRTATVAALIAGESAPARLRVAPEDHERLAGAQLPVELVADPALEAGALRLETGVGWIEDGPRVRLDRLRAALDAMTATR